LCKANEARYFKRIKRSSFIARYTVFACNCLATRGNRLFNYVLKLVISLGRCIKLSGLDTGIKKGLYMAYQQHSDLPATLICLPAKFICLPKRVHLFANSIESYPGVNMGYGLFFAG
jgi:hypothetical protein